MIAAGRANHAGRGSWQGKTGNSRFIGIEAENTGHPTGPKAGPWPAVQLDAYQRGVAAILTRLGQDASWCCGHKEWRTEKPDPHSIDMEQFRADVTKLIGNPEPGPLIPAKDPQDRPTLRRQRSSNPCFLVKEVQKKLGFATDKIDGQFGPITEAAMRRFQRENGLRK